MVSVLFARSPDEQQSGVEKIETKTPVRSLRLAGGFVTGVLGLIFLISAVLNLGYKIQLGSTLLSFSAPSASIAEFETAIGLLLLVAAVISNLYLYGAAYFLAIVGITFGLLTPTVQGLAHTFHFAMIPLGIAGIGLLIAEEVSTRKSQEKSETSKTVARRSVLILQIFVGGLVTLGGAAYALAGTYPVGTAIGAIHLLIGFVNIYAAFVYTKRGSSSRGFLIALNAITFAYSALSEAAAQLYAFLPPGIGDALIGTIIAMIVDTAIVCLLL